MQRAQCRCVPPNKASCRRAQLVWRLWGLGFNLRQGLRGPDDRSSRERSPQKHTPARRSMNDQGAKQKVILQRIEAAEDALARAKQYLETGAHEHWHGFRALFAPKQRSGIDLPPHPAWIRNVFVPRVEKVLDEAERALEQVNRKGRDEYAKAKVRLEADPHV